MSTDRDRRQGKQQRCSRDGRRVVGKGTQCVAEGKDKATAQLHANSLGTTNFEMNCFRTINVSMNGITSQMVSQIPWRQNSSSSSSSITLPIMSVAEACFKFSRFALPQVAGLDDKEIVYL
eukprot:1161304-Pelagomonas_calceolata.AAC.3